MLTIVIPADGADIRRDTLVDVAHHQLQLDRGLEPGELVVAVFLDDSTWLAEVVDLEFTLGETRYLLRATHPRGQRVAPAPERGRPVTTAQVTYLLDLMASERLTTATAPRS
ncbi:MAG: hypothetical protein F2667_02375 [Actinobacteria bacterium]|uniref:Unannotated protein n=1 Tax=freshwater metagenome TaxID=449393 RepID=A0A6J6NYL2_9ZZZZ|nr:hypothetical protein [Actinomycetota bacterium]